MYAFTREANGVYMPRSYIKSPSPQAADRFGGSNGQGAVLTPDGSMLFVKSAHMNGTGAVYVY